MPLEVGFHVEAREDVLGTKGEGDQVVRGVDKGAGEANRRQVLMVGQMDAKAEPLVFAFRDVDEEIVHAATAVEADLLDLLELDIELFGKFSHLVGAFQMQLQFFDQQKALLDDEKGFWWMVTRAVGWEIFFQDKVEADAAFAQLAEEDILGPVLDDQHNNRESN